MTSSNDVNSVKIKVCGYLVSKECWNHVYKTGADLSWHQDEPEFSFELIRDLAPAGGSMIDVGGGSFLLVG